MRPGHEMARPQITGSSTDDQQPSHDPEGRTMQLPQSEANPGLHHRSRRRRYRLDSDDLLYSCLRSCKAYERQELYLSRLCISPCFAPVLAAGRGDPVAPGWSLISSISASAHYSPATSLRLHPRFPSSSHRLPPIATVCPPSIIVHRRWSPPLVPAVRRRHSLPLFHALRPFRRRCSPFLRPPPVRPTGRG